MKQFRNKVVNSIERYIDQLENQIISSLGGQESNVEEDFNLINQRIQALSKQVQKQVRLLSGEKTLKGIITHYSNNMPQFYDDKLDQIQYSIGDLQSKDLSMCKEFRITQMTPINQKIHQLYKGIFVGSIKPITLKGRDSRISKGSRISTTGNGFYKKQ